MTYADLAKKHNMTIDQIRNEALNFLYCEGYDDAGNEYATLDNWLSKKSESVLMIKDPEYKPDFSSLWS